MGRTKGTKKTGGRTKGTPNKTTVDVRVWLSNVLDGERGEFLERLRKLDDRDYIKTYTQLLNYITPKITQQTESKEFDRLMEIVERSPDSIINKLIDALND